MFNVKVNAMLLVSALLVSQAAHSIEPVAEDYYSDNQICHMGVRIDNSNQNKGVAWTQCTKEAAVHLYVTEQRTGKVLCTEYFPANIFLPPKCSFDRIPGQPMDIKVEVHSDGKYFSTQRHLQKPATFEYPVSAEYAMVLKNLSAQAKKREFPKRGTQYSTEIKVKVIDQDIIAADPQKEIRLELINAKTGQVVQEVKASTNETVSFKLTGFYEKPRFVGQEGWLQSKELQPGLNEFIVVVHDAYRGSDIENAVNLESVIIEVPQNPAH